MTKNQFKGLLKSLKKQKRLSEDSLVALVHQMTRKTKQNLAVILGCHHSTSEITSRLSLRLR